MKKHEIITYSFDELSEDAKQKAINHFRNDNFDYVTDEARDTLDKFCDIFSINWRHFDYCEMYRSEWSIKLDDNILALSGLRLAKYIYNNFYIQLTKGKYYGHLKTVRNERFYHPCIENYLLTAGKNKGKYYLSYKSRITREIDNCPLTGVCYDYSILKPIVEFLKNPNKRTDFETLLNDCLHSLANDVSSEIEYHQSDKGIKEMIDANEYDFTEDGELF